MTARGTEEQAGGDLVATFEGIARLVLAASTLEETLAAIVASAVRLIDQCDYAGVSLVEEDRSVTTRASSDHLALLVDEMQYETGEGPCLDAIAHRELVSVEDLAMDVRWPSFSARAAGQSGILSILCLPLFVEERSMGALNLYSVSARAFSDESRAVASVFAAHSSVAVIMAERMTHLQSALRSRATIEQAKGVIMATTRCTPDQAFDLLRQQSQALNEKLRDIAAEIIESHSASGRQAPA